MSASTRPIEAASLKVGMMTETRNGASPDRDGRIAAREGGVETEAASGTPERQAGGHDHGNEELPDPRGPPPADQRPRSPAKAASPNRRGPGPEPRRSPEAGPPTA